MALNQHEQEEFLTSLGLSTDGEVPDLDTHPKKRPKSPVAELENLPAHILREAPEQLPFDGSEEAEEAKLKAKNFFDAHKANRGDIRTGDVAVDKALKSAYNSWLWKAVTSAGKAAKQERRSLARAVASTQADEDRRDLRRHLKETAAENEEELVARIGEATVARILALLTAKGMDLSNASE